MVIALAEVRSFAALRAVGFFVIALASFASGIGMASGRCCSCCRQARRLSMRWSFGQSLAAFGAPLLARRFGFEWGYWSFALLATVWLAVWLASRDAPRRANADCSARR